MSVWAVIAPILTIHNFKRCIWILWHLLTRCAEQTNTQSGRRFRNELSPLFTHSLQCNAHKFKSNALYYAELVTTSKTQTKRQKKSFIEQILVARAAFNTQRERKIYFNTFSMIHFGSWCTQSIQLTHGTAYTVQWIDDKTRPIILIYCLGSIYKQRYNMFIGTMWTEEKKSGR